MKYILKDRELQAKLDEISGGDFTKKLETEGQREYNALLRREVVRVYFGEFDPLASKFSALFELDEMEEVPSYDPHAWNDLSDVRPPELGIYRVEVFENADDSEPEFKRAGYWDGRRFHIEKYGARVRFRPWEDEE